MRPTICGSDPSTFTPAGVRTPVVSMSMRPLIGMVQALVTPGTSSAWFSSATNWSCEMLSGVMCRKTFFSSSGAHAEYHVGTRRHSATGFSVITVSSMDSGAGSVAVSARPALPSTRSTSGNCRMMRSVTCNSRWASVMEMPGIADGMYSSAPSFSGGMNSDPSRRTMGTVQITSASAPPITSRRWRSDQRTTGS